MPTNGISETNNNKTINIREEEPKFLVITNSVLTDNKEIYFALYKKGASIHYLIDKEGYQTQFANENEQTFTNGCSYFRRNISLNKLAVNLMFVNSGNEPYTQEQRDKFIAFLKDFKIRNSNIDLKTNFLGLSEVAIIEKMVATGEGKIFPRHEAPGKIFWEGFVEELAKLGFGLFLSTTPVQKENIYTSPKSPQQEILVLQNKLRDYGYAIEASGIYDEATKAWVTRFNQRYVPGNTKELDALWTEASELNLDYQNHINAEKNIQTQLPLQARFFNNSQAGDPSTNTNAVDGMVRQTSNLSM